jgi:hypothetical protein
LPRIEIVSSQHEDFKINSTKGVFLLSHFSQALKRGSIWISLLVLVSFVIGSGFAASERSSPLGLRPPTQAEKEWLQKNTVQIKTIYFNQLGLKRVNCAQKLLGLKTFSESMAVPMGQEIVPLTAADSKLEIKTDTSLAEALPSAVDNSELSCFPEIRSQGSIGSCVHFSATYYQMTHMVGLIRNWDVKHDSGDERKFSPKFTYNLENGGSDSGDFIGGAYQAQFKMGCATWADFPYDGDGSNPLNYREWPITATIWRNALNYRMDKLGSIQIYDSNSATPVTSPDDSDLIKIKQLLNNGYVLHTGTYISSWLTTVTGNDPSTAADDVFVGQLICYAVAGINGGHAMTIVGYNDNIWVDINANGVVDSGEKGAFKLANSWGTNYGNQGFVWFAYDALNAKSAVVGGPSPLGRRYGWTDGQISQNVNIAYWITAREEYNPQLLAEATLSHGQRGQVSVKLGFSDPSQEQPVAVTTTFLNNIGGAYALDGSATLGDATFIFDLTDFLTDYDLADGEMRRWYLKLSDRSCDKYPATLKSFRMIDEISGATAKATYGIPLTVNGSSSSSWVDYTPYFDFVVKTVTPSQDQKLGLNETMVPTVYIANSSNQNVSCSYYFDGETTPRETVSATSTATPRTVSFNSYDLSSLSEGNHQLIYEAQEETTVKRVIVPFKVTPIKLQFYNSFLGLDSYSIKPNFKLINTGLAPLDLGRVKLRYYYTGDSNTDEEQVFVCKSSIATSVTGSFIKMPNPVEGADTYLEIGFAKNRVILQPNESLELAVEFYKKDCRTYIETDDYSFRGYANQSFAEWDKVSVYVDNELKWGPDLDPMVYQVQLEMYNQNRNPESNQIYPEFNLTNNDTRSIQLSNLKIRYYFTANGTNQNNFWCDYASVGNGYVTDFFNELSEPVSGADNYLEIGFLSAAGFLEPGASIILKTRFTKQDWTNFNQVDDYSFSTEAVVPILWTKTPVYVNKVLCSGSEPE